MKEYIDKNLNPHSFDDHVSKDTQEGTQMSPPILPMENEEGMYVPYVPLDCFNELKRIYKKIIQDKENEFNNRLQEKDCIIEELKTKNRLASNRKTVNNEKKLYLYDPILFPDKVDGDKVVDALVNLLYLKVGEKWLIRNKRCWVIAWRILKWNHCLYESSNLSDFCRLVNEVVLQQIDDEERKLKIMCDINNFTSIQKDDYPPFMFEPPKWLINYRYDPKGCKSLNIALQIKKALDKYLNLE